jgi:acyl-CoA reductase-like NAD-dependent aldehyde dehydrogenase
VHDSIYDQVVEGSVALARKRKMGNPFDPASQQGALISQAHLDKVLGYVKKAQSEGAELMCGGNRVGDEGYYMEPTVFAGCEDHMSVFNEEVPP